MLMAWASQGEWDGGGMGMEGAARRRVEVDSGERIDEGVLCGYK